jgi:hypothetical protein
VVSAVTELELEDDDAIALVDFWDLVFLFFTVIVINISSTSKVLQGHPFTSDERRNKALALLSSLVHCVGFVPWCYFLSTSIEYNPASIGHGSFGMVHRGLDQNLCIKVTNYTDLHVDLIAVRFHF